MKELKMKIHLSNWDLKPIYVKHSRIRKFSFLFLTFEILKKIK